MPKTHFICKDGETCRIERCLRRHGCRMGERCAPLPYLNFAAEDWRFKRVTPSMAGNGPRYIYLKETIDYAEKPEDMAFASTGIHTHDRLAQEKLTKAVLSEERLTDEQMTGIVDELEEDEDAPGFYVLTDYKTWGSFMVAKALGIVTIDVPMVDDNGNPVYYVRGKNKGQQKMVKEVTLDPSRSEMPGTEYQLNRYRIMIEGYGFPVSKMRVFAIPRDAGTWIAEKRGITDRTYIIPVRKLPDEKVLDYYFGLQQEIDHAFRTGDARKCAPWECWDGIRCDRYCPVREACDDMGV